MSGESYAHPLRDGTLSIKLERRPPTMRYARLFPHADGRLRSASDSYATARSGAVDQVNTTDPYMYVGQNKSTSTPLYRLHEGFVEFDFDDLVGGIPADATIEAVALKAMLRTKATGDGEFTIEAFAFDWGTSINAADWRSNVQLGALTKVAQKATAQLSVDVGFTFDDVALVAAVQAALASGKLRLVLASNRLRTATAPTGNEYVGIHSSEAESVFWSPRLEVAWTPAWTPAEVDITDAPPTQLQIANSGPGGFGGASFRLPAAAVSGPYDALDGLFKRGDLLTITHGDPPVTLHEGELTDDVEHPIVEGGKAYYEFTSAGLWWRAGQRKDFAAVLLDDDIGQWFVSPLAAQGYTLDLEGHIYLAVEAKQSVEAGRAAGIFYWLSDGLGSTYAEIREFFAVVRWSCPVSGGATDVTLDYSVTTPYGTGLASPWTNLRTWSLGQSTTGTALRVDLSGLNAKALRFKIGVPDGTDGFNAPREFEVLDPCVVVAPIDTLAITSIATGNPAVVTTAMPHKLATGDRVFIYGSNSTPRVDGWRTVTVVDSTRFSVAVNVTTAGSAGTVRRGLRVDEAMAEVVAGELTGITNGLAQLANTEPVGLTHWNLVARPHESRADTLDSFAMLSPAPFDYGFWDNHIFNVRPRPATPPAAHHYVVDPAAAGVDVDVASAREDAPTHVKVLYSYRAPNDLNDADSYKTSNTPNGITMAVYRPEDLLDRAPAGIAVDVWDEFADLSMTHDEAVALADQILAWLSANQISGTVNLSVPYIALAGGGQKLAAYIRGGDAIDIAGRAGYERLPITSVEIDADSGGVTLGIGEERREFVARLRGERDIAAPRKHLKPGWWRKKKK